MNFAEGTIHYYRRFWEEYRQRNIVGLSAFLMKSAAKTIILTNTSTWHYLCLANPIPRITPQVSATFGFLPMDEARTFFRDHHSSFPWMYIAEELEVAERCSHLFPCLAVGGNVAAYVKLGLSAVFVLDFNQVLHLPKGTAFIYDCFVEPSFRRRGIGSAIISMTSQYLKENGFEAVWAQIPAWNIASRKMFRLSGFRPAGDVRYVRLLGKELFLTHPQDFPLRIEHGKGGMPEVRLKHSAAPKRGPERSQAPLGTDLYEKEKQMEIAGGPERVQERCS